MQGDEIQNQINSQQEKLSLIIQNNEIISNSISNLDKKLDEIIDSKPEQKKDITFNILDKTIIIDGKPHSYIQEEVICGSQEIINKFTTIQNEYLFPQGIDYCKSLVDQEIQKGEDAILIIFKDGQKNCFFFPLKNYDDLMYTQSRLYRYNVDKKKKEKIISDFQKVYISDQYPQGRTYISSLIDDFMKCKNHLLFIFRENNDGTWTRYYFKEKEATPKLKKAKLEIIQGDKLKNELKMNQSNANFPQGYQNYQKLIQNQIEKNDKIFVYKGYVNVQAKKTDVYYYNECLFLKTAMYVIFLISNEDLDSILNDIDEGYNFIQGKSFAKNLVLERKGKGEAIHYVHAGGGRYLY